MEGSGEWLEYRVPFTAAADMTDLRFDLANLPRGTNIHMELGWIMLADASTVADWDPVFEPIDDDPLSWIQRGSRTDTE
jgi:hypothetical protein